MLKLLFLGLNSEKTRLKAFLQVKISGIRSKIYSSKLLITNTVSSVSIMSFMTERYDTLLAFTISSRCPLYCLIRVFLSLDEQLFINSMKSLTPSSSLTMLATFCTKSSMAFCFSYSNIVFNLSLRINLDSWNQ